jgi:hypothetical protein
MGRVSNCGILLSLSQTYAGYEAGGHPRGEREREAAVPEGGHTLQGYQEEGRVAQRGLGKL